MIESTNNTIPENEPERQFYYIGECKKIINAYTELTGRKLTYHISTFGCQMNFKDSEKLAGVLEEIGYTEEESENADFVIYNTCTVRENANSRVYGRLGYAGKLKTKNKNMIIAICGCMMQEPDEVELIKKSYRFVDIIFGTHNIFKLAELLYEFLIKNKHFEHSESLTDNEKDKKIKKQLKKNKNMVVDIWEGTDKIVEELPSKLKSSFKAGINIMFGCNNFCSYCIVPYVRGRERSRKPEDIIKEIRQFVANGVIEIMLLGQNVNSYGKTLENPISFAKLLTEIEKIDGLKRIRFMTSHPKDLSDELIEVMKNSTKICRHIHLPVQSGSTQLLKKMNRKYTKEGYLGLIEKIRREIPDIAITTDIIVGFPGESEEDFQDTVDVCEKSHYSSAFTFIYSKRTGTPAAKMTDQVDEETVKNRFNRLLEVINRSSNEYASSLTGKIMPVLVEEKDRENNDGKEYLTGRLDNNLLVHFEGCDRLIGELVNVKLVECKGFYFIGKLQE